MVAGARVVIVGYFSAKQKDFGALMNAAAAVLTSRGAQVVGRAVQRRGVSDGGAKKMLLPYSSRTLLSYGKIREVTTTCNETRADVVVFLTPLTQRQRRALTLPLARPALGLADIQTTPDSAEGPLPAPPGRR
jgi:50S ribosomal subunit-associated GTPase HflX